MDFYPQGGGTGAYSSVPSSSQYIVTPADHGLAVGDWIGVDDSAAAKWRKVRALISEPRCEGVVTAVASATAFTLTSGGKATLTGHGWSRGPLYLSQSTAGLATTTGPASGVSRQVATVIDADELLVLCLPEAVL